MAVFWQVLGVCDEEGYLQFPQHQNWILRRYPCVVGEKVKVDQEDLDQGSMAWETKKYKSTIASLSNKQVGGRLLYVFLPANEMSYIQTATGGIMDHHPPKNIPATGVDSAWTWFSLALPRSPLGCSPCPLAWKESRVGMFEGRASYLGRDWRVAEGPPLQLKLLDGSMQVEADKLSARIGETIDWPSFFMNRYRRKETEEKTWKLRLY